MRSALQRSTPPPRPRRDLRALRCTTALSCKTTVVAMSALDTEAPAWEMSKENAAPRKKGRDVAKLNRAFGAAPDDDAAIRHHEAALSMRETTRSPTSLRVLPEQHRPTDALAALSWGKRPRVPRRRALQERRALRAMWLDYADNLETPTTSSSS